MHPNVTKIFLSFTIHSPDNTSGLLLGLSLINPTRLLLYENRKLKNKWVMQLLGTLVAGINNWSNLTTVALSHDRFNGHGLARDQFLAALPSPKTVKIVSVGRFDIYFLKKIATIPSLQAIQIRQTSRSLGSSFTESEIQIQAPVIEDIMMAPADPIFYPMTSAPQSVVDSIWK
ncbi:hypothetical protein DFH09DRAFT_1308540 [Mycena vulgaris]|nr:hypothetical protein DFH09DRAFT_1308540 [Mycena vulgaris]